jgi:hypothetical protein
MDTVLTPGGLQPIVFVGVVFGILLIAYAVGRVRGGHHGGISVDGDEPSAPTGPSADCKAACDLWRKRRLATCKAVQEEALAKSALDSAQKDETRAFQLWLFALTALIVVAVYHVEAWIIPAALALTAAVIYWGYCKGLLSDANAKWLEKRYATSEAIGLDNGAQDEVIKNCSPADAQACLSMPPCNL